MSERRDGGGIGCWVWMVWSLAMTAIISNVLQTRRIKELDARLTALESRAAPEQTKEDK